MTRVHVKSSAVANRYAVACTSTAIGALTLLFIICHLYPFYSLVETSDLNVRQWTHVSLDEHYCIECRDAFLKPSVFTMNNTILSWNTLQRRLFTRKVHRLAATVVEQ